MPKEQDLYCYSGQTWSQTITFKRSGEPIDLSGSTAKAQVRPVENSQTLSAEMTCVVLGSAGKIMLGLSSEQSSRLRPGNYRYDLKVTNGTDVQYYICGKFIVKGRVTE